MDRTQAPKCCIWAYTNLRRTVMNLYKAIQDLCTEKEELDRVIAALEKLQRSAGLRITPATRQCESLPAQIDEPRA
jgi:hypothetical protein